MSQLILPALLMLLVSFAGLQVWMRSVAELRDARLRALRQDLSEKARQRAERERWESIDLERLHPLNREEVRRLLTLADADGVGALKPSERLFLDNMALPRAGA
jgi:hypothetical protein